MKITDHLGDLVIELGELESFEKASMVIDQDGISMRSLLELFSGTSNVRSKEVIMEIIDEIGYGHLIELNQSAVVMNELENMGESADASKSVQDPPARAGKVCIEDLMSDADFLFLVPVGPYMH